MEEINRQKRVLDMMVSIHFKLHDTYKYKALFIEIFLLSASVVLNALVFVDYKYFQRFSISAEDAQLYTGVFSVLVFALSVVMLLVNWREKCTKHAQAAKELCKLLQEAREIIDAGQANNQLLLTSFNDKYKQINNVITSIPDKKFNRLKAYHLRKVELSKYISKHPKNPYWLIRVKFFFHSLNSDEAKNQPQ